MPPWLFWLLLNLVWLGVAGFGYVVLRRTFPDFAASHSPETGGVLVLFVVALAYALASA